MLTTDLPFLDDPDGAAVPSGLPPVIDAHVHVFPHRLFGAVQQWFDRHAWKIRYRMSTAEIFDFLLSRGVRHIVALQYAHRPAMAAELNDYMIAQCRPYAGRVTGLATVFPGEANAADILQTAFDGGLAGVKLHAHVQCFDLAAETMAPIFACCRRNDKPLVIHAGREPKSDAYRCDPHRICRVEKVQRVLEAFPGLKLCVPHLGFDELDAYRHLMDRHDNLWLDTTMVLADYFPLAAPIDLRRYRPDRILYGSDFPNIPYPWDRELKKLAAAGLDDDLLERILNRNARELFGVE
ncbi:MAG: amidohydrolase family protein [Desulfobacteraceae bacterium]|nr:amidohydrolase family protein [Desulfobacteraceae bacterium]